MKVPDTSGVPLIVIVFDAHVAVTPEGRPVGAPMPVAPVVACVMAGSAVWIHTVGAKEATEAVFVGVTERVAVAVAVQPLLSVSVTVYGPAADAVSDGLLPEGDQAYEAMLAPGLAAPFAVKVAISPSHRVPSSERSPEVSASVSEACTPYAGSSIVTELSAVQLFPFSVTVTE